MVTDTLVIVKYCVCARGRISFRYYKAWDDLLVSFLCLVSYLCEFYTL